MSKVMVVYWSQGGNTEAMANAVAQGASESGASAQVIEVGKANLEDLKAAAGFALGCPAMGSEVLEESEMEPFVAEVEQFAAGRQIALFGSYGWGDGEWMRDWEARMKAAGAVIVGDAGVIAQEAPDDAAISACQELGKQLSAL